ncbi:PHB depolymerase family esterase [soil metagenome]
MTSGGDQRWYLQAVPASYEATTPTPVVLDFHGYGEGAELHQDMSDLRTLGGQEGFITVTPQGLGDPPQWTTTLGSPDLAFVGDLIDQVEADLCVDTNRVFSTGLSNGARLTSAIACQYGDRIAAAATVSGVRAIDGCEFSRPVPVLAFHGTADDTVPFEGGLGEGNLDAPAPDGSGRPWRDTLTDDEIRELGAKERPIPEVMADWAERNGCGADTTEREEASDVTAVVWDCPADGSTELLRITGGGHTWPGSTLSQDLVGVLGHTTMTIDADELMWAFFEDHPLSGTG